MLVELLKHLLKSLGRYITSAPARTSIGSRPADSMGTVTTSQTLSFSTEEPAAELSRELLKPIDWQNHRTHAPPPQVACDPLYQRWSTMPGGHKWTHYFSVYQQVFGPRRLEPLRILEIGVHLGSSLLLWRHYFSNPATLIVGIDIWDECARFDDPANGINVRIGSQEDPAFLHRVLQEFGPFDIIIDDGSHCSSHIIASFNSLYSKGLNERGIYFVEDLHANYWLPWRNSEKSFFDICKELLELMHAHYQSGDAASFLKTPPSERPASIKVPAITTMLDELRFFDSIAVIYKAHRVHPPCYLTA